MELGALCGLPLLDGYLYYSIPFKVRVLGWVSGGKTLEDVHSFYYLAEDGVFAVKVVLWGIGNEELAAIGVGSGVGHR